MVEIDGSNIPEIIKFNYLLTLREGQTKNDILGLPHTMEGYAQAKKILEENYIMDIYIHKRLIMELETLPKIINIIQMKDMHEPNLKNSYNTKTHIYSILTIFRIGGMKGKKPPPLTSFSPVTSTIAGISP